MGSVSLNCQKYSTMLVDDTEKPVNIRQKQRGIGFRAPSLNPSFACQNYEQLSSCGVACNIQQGRVLISFPKESIK